MGKNIARQVVKLIYPVTKIQLVAALTVLVTVSISSAASLMHTGSNLGTKYSGGTWGAGWTCITCHDPNSTNIKRVATTVNGKSVSFLQVTGAQKSFGNDARARLGKSTNVCEVCHTQTIYHQYSTNPISKPLSGGYTHNNKSDCASSCHPHNQGFAGKGCDGCHGNPPTTSNVDGSNNTGMVWSPSGTGATNPVGPGAHAKHSARSIGCDACHNGNTMPTVSYTIQMGFNVNGSNWAGFPGTVTFGTISARVPTNASFSFVNGNAGTLVRQAAASRNSCNVYCHGNWAGANGNLNASWEGGSTQAACGSCHAASTAIPPTSWPASNAHAKHAGNGAGQYQKGCSTCHSGVDGTNAHVNGTVAVALTNGTYSKVTGMANPSTANGTCRATYCHSNGKSFTTFTGNTRPTWNTAGPLACSACHGYVSNTSGPNYTTGKANSHVAHIGRTCQSCHNTVVDAAGAIASTVLHANQTYNVIPLSANFVLTNTPNPTTPATCNTITCHGGNNAPATWGTPLNCNGCHPINALKGAHAAHINNTLVPALYNYTANRSTATTYNFGCSNCHPQDEAAKHVDGFIDVTLRSTNSGAGGTVSYLRSRNTTATADLINVAGSGITGTSGSSVVCAASYCHSNAYATNQKFMASPNWYTTYSGDKCAMCHGNSPNANDPVNQPGSPAHYRKGFLGYANVSGGHGVGIHTKQIFTGTVGLAKFGNTSSGSHGKAATSTTINCNMCHYKTVTTYANDKNKMCAPCHTSLIKNPAELIADKSFHVNGNINVDFAPIKVKSKAQMRDADIPNEWSRQKGYKAKGSYDVAFKTFTTATQWNGTTKTCDNISCHNGVSITWTEPSPTCASCHQ